MPTTPSTPAPHPAQDVRRERPPETGRLPEWRDTWIPSLAAIPASIAAGVLFSGLGDGAATRATTVVWLLWLAFVAFQLLRKGKRSHVKTAF